MKLVAGQKLMVLDSMVPACVGKIATVPPLSAEQLNSYAAQGIVPYCFPDDAVIQAKLKAYLCAHHGAGWRGSYYRTCSSNVRLVYPPVKNKLGNFPRKKVV